MFTRIVCLGTNNLGAIKCVRLCSQTVIACLEINRLGSIESCFFLKHVFSIFLMYNNLKIELYKKIMC